MSGRANTQHIRTFEAALREHLPAGAIVHNAYLDCPGETGEDDRICCEFAYQGEVNTASIPSAQAGDAQALVRCAQQIAQALAPKPSRVIAAWRVCQEERRRFLEKRMSAPPMSARGAANKMAQDGIAWVRELGKFRGGFAPDDVEEFSRDLAVTTIPNLTALAQAGAIDVDGLILGGIATGVGAGYLTGWDLGAADRALEIATILESMLCDGHGDALEVDLKRYVEELRSRYGTHTVTYTHTMEPPQ